MLPVWQRALEMWPSRIRAVQVFVAAFFRLRTAGDEIGEVIFLFLVDSLLLLVRVREAISSGDGYPDLSAARALPNFFISLPSLS